VHAVCANVAHLSSAGEYIDTADRHLFPLVRLILPIILWWSRIHFNHILKGAILSYPRKRLPLGGIEPTATIKYTHESLTIKLLCHDITTTLYGHMDFVGM